MNKTCQACGEIVSSKESFCSECGTTVKKANTQEHTILTQKKTLGHMNTTPIATQQVPTSFNNLSDNTCKEFLLEWNSNASMFLAGYTSSLQFRISPKSSTASFASDFRLFIRHQHTTNFVEEKLMFAQISRQTAINISYSPKVENCGINQKIELCLSYMMDGEIMWYGLQLLIDIYPQTTSPDKLAENLTIKLENITADRASDLKLNLLNKQQVESRSNLSLLESFKKSIRWTQLTLTPYMPIKDLGEYSQCSIPQAPLTPTDKLTLCTQSGIKIHIYGNKVTLGRDKTNDIMTRNLPQPGESAWDINKLRQMNGRISGCHCSIAVNDTEAFITDTQSTNGTFFENCNTNYEHIPLNTPLSISLASPQFAPENFTMQFIAYECEPKHNPLAIQVGMDLIQPQTYGGILITRDDSIAESYVVVNRWIPLYFLDASAEKNWLLYRHEANFALTDGSEWIWLTPNVKLPLSTGIQSIIPHQQFMG